MSNITFQEFYNFISSHFPCKIIKGYNNQDELAVIKGKTICSFEIINFKEEDNCAKEFKGKQCIRLDCWDKKSLSGGGYIIVASDSALLEVRDFIKKHIPAFADLPSRPHQMSIFDYIEP